MDLNLLSMSDSRMIVKRKIDQHLLLSDPHSSLTYYWQFITSILQFGKLTLKAMRGQYTSQLQPTELIIHAVLSRQHDQVLSLSRRLTVSMFGTSLTSLTNHLWHSTSQLVRSCTASSNSSSMPTTSSTWLMVTRTMELFSCTRCLLTWRTFRITSKRTSKSSGTKRSKSVSSLSSKGRGRRRNSPTRRWRQRRTRP